MVTPSNVTDLFAVTKQTWLEEARDTAEMLLKDRYTITIEDVLKETPLPKYLHRNTIGQVFKDQRFSSVGFVYSQRPAMNGRIIRKWTLAHARPTREDFDCA